MVICFTKRFILMMKFLAMRAISLCWEYGTMNLSFWETTKIIIKCGRQMCRHLLIGMGVPDLPSGEDNYRFGGDVTQTIRLPINTTRTPQSQHHFSSGYQPCAARLTSPRRLILACESKTQARTRKNTI
jgi:hypothetical protein